MSETEPKKFEFVWHKDAEGEFLRLKCNGESLEARNINTIMYLFPDQPKYDHIFVITEDEGDRWRGVHLFRGHIDKLAEGAFGNLCDQMFERDFEVAPDEEPSLEDIEIYNEYFGVRAIETTATDTIDEIVKVAMANIDAEIDYIEGEEL